MNDFPIELINEYNEFLKVKGSVIKLYQRSYAVDIKLLEDDYLKKNDQIIIPDREFYKDLEMFFKGKDIEIEYNNTGSCFWCK